jgi:hypothetical protein
METELFMIHLLFDDNTPFMLLRTKNNIFKPTFNKCCVAMTIAGDFQVLASIMDDGDWRHEILN